MRNFSLKTLLYSVIILTVSSLLGGFYLISRHVFSSWGVGRVSWWEAIFIFIGSTGLFSTVAAFLCAATISPFLEFINKKIDWRKVDKKPLRYETITEEEYNRRRLNQSF